MKKILIVFVSFIAYVMLVNWLSLGPSKAVKDDTPKVETETKIEENADQDIVDSYNNALNIIIGELEKAKEVFSKSDAVSEEIKKKLTEAKNLQKMLKEARKDEQKLQASGEITDFITRYNDFMDQCNNAYDKQEREKSDRDAATKSEKWLVKEM